MLSRILETALGLRTLDDVVARASLAPIGGSPFRSAARLLGVSMEVTAQERLRIPKRGPAIVVANHPTGFAEGVALPALLDEIRDDVRAIGHSWFTRWPALAERMFLVDPQGGRESRAQNTRALRDAQAWLESGHMLFFCPAGQVARWDARRRRLIEGSWRGGLRLLLRNTGAPVIPVRIVEQPGWIYKMMSAIHPRLGASVLGLEMLARRGAPLSAAVGEPARETSAQTRGEDEMVDALRRWVIGSIPSVA
jgi:putative hemolysin